MKGRSHARAETAADEAEAEEPGEESAKGSSEEEPAKDKTPGIDPIVRRRKSLDKARKLLSRAVHPNTPEEEARTTALIAAREIHDHKLLEPAPRHPIIDRLEGLEDGVLDHVAGLLEDLLSDWPSNLRRSAGVGSTPVMLDLVRWRNEARAVNQRLQLHVFSLRAVLETGRIALAERAGRCEACPRPIAVGEMIAWRRRRSEAIHYLCYIDNLSRRAF